MIGVDSHMRSYQASFIWLNCHANEWQHVFDLFGVYWIVAYLIFRFHFIETRILNKRECRSEHSSTTTTEVMKDSTWHMERTSWDTLFICHKKMNETELARNKSDQTFSSALLIQICSACFGHPLDDGSDNRGRSVERRSPVRSTPPLPVVSSRLNCDFRWKVSLNGNDRSFPDRETRSANWLQKGKDFRSVDLNSLSLQEWSSGK